MDFTNCSNISNASGSVEKYLQHLQDKTNITMIPAVTMLIVFAVTGLIGNTLVLVVYSQKFKLTPTKVLIMTIACFDLVANVAAIPVAIVAMLDTWNFTRPGVCKANFLGAVTSMGGAISLLIVAVIRYRKVCKPYGWQVSNRHAIIASATTFLIAIMVSIPYTFIYGVRTRQTACPGIKGSECFTSDYYYYTIWPILNNMLFMAIYLALSVSLVVLYTLLGVTAWKHRKLHGASANIPKVKTTDSSSPGVSSVDKEQGGMPDELPEIQQTISSKLIQRIHAGKGGVPALLCCTRQQEGGSSEDNTQSSVTLKTFTATDSENEGNDSDKITPDVEFTITKKPTSSIDASMTVSRNNRFDDSEKWVNYENKEEAKGIKNIQIEFTNEGKNTPDGTVINKDCKTKAQQENNTERELRKQNAPATKATTSKPQNRRPVGRMTAMLVIISAIFVLGFLPFMILTVFKNKFPAKYEAMTMLQQTFYHLFYRLYFLNSAANPIIYSLCDANFRRQCVHVLTCRLRKRYL